LIEIIKKHYLFLFIVLQTSIYSQVLETKPYSFDLGTSNSYADELSTQLGTGDIYKKEIGYGFTSQVLNSFERANLFSKNLRDEFTYDGVCDKQIGFKIDLPKGKWWFTFWMEAGFEDVPTTKIYVNKVEQIISWHQLKPDEEGAIKLSPVYRVVKLLCELKNDFLEISINGVQDSVRLLGFTFIPATAEVDNNYPDLNKIIIEAGRYKSPVSAVEIKGQIKRKLMVDKTDAYLFYWYQQLGFLSEAERFKAYEGWEWATELTDWSIFDRMHQALMLYDAIVELDYSDHNPLKQRAIWSRGKICFDLFLERGGDYQKKISEKDLNELAKIFPDDSNLKMLTGAQIGLHDRCDELSTPSNAPKWAVLQREVLCRLGDEIAWWVNERQAPNGELGGKIDDDVEILRNWLPMLIYGDENTITGWKKLADAIWNNPRVLNGYSKKIRDVEHSSEFISDSQPALLIISDDSTYSNRLKFTADLFENLWSSNNKFGHRFFKSAWLGAKGIDETPPKNRDIDMNAQALKPLRFLAWTTKEKRYIDLINEWSYSWLNISLSTDKGKPKGIFPASVRGYDEAINGDEPNWYDANMFWHYYDWSNHNGNRILDHLLFTYSITSDDSLLIPMELTLKFITEVLSNNPAINNSDVTIGSDEWIVQRYLNSSSFWSNVQNWRILTNKNEFDNLLKNYGSFYIKYLLTKDESELEKGLEQILSTLRFNAPLRTNLVMHTDRVRTPGIDHLTAMICGDATHNGSSPFLAASWINTDGECSILIEENSSESMQVSIYNFDEAEKKVGMKIWKLLNGTYRLTQNDSANEIETIIKITNPGQVFDLKFKPGSLTTISIIKFSD